jgi:hypothetical protein
MKSLRSFDGMNVIENLVVLGIVAFAVYCWHRNRK